MQKIMLTLAAAGLLASASAHADANLDLAKQKQCLSCHAVNAELLAPSFKMIAHKYEKVANAQERLVSVVMKGSADNSGTHWGTMKMPSPGSRAPVSDAEAKQLVEWVLSQK